MESLPISDELAAAGRLPAWDRGLSSDEQATVMANMHLAAEVAGGYLDRGLPPDQLMQIGATGVETAVRLAGVVNYDDFESHVRCWVRRTVVGTLAAREALTDFVADFQQELGRQPQRIELQALAASQQGCLDRELGLQLLRLMTSTPPVALEAETASPFEPAPAEPAETFEFDGELFIPITWLAGLEQDRGQALILRYGLDGSGVRTNKEVSEKLGCSPQFVSKLLREATGYLATNGIASSRLQVYPYLFDGIPENYQRILEKRLGFNDNRPLTIKEVSEALEIEYSKAASGEITAINKIRKLAQAGRYRNLVPEAVNGMTRFVQRHESRLQKGLI